MTVLATKIDRPDMAAKATEALKGSVKLSNEIIGIMNLLDSGIPPTPGMIKAMRRYTHAIEAFVDKAERLTW
jgi:hypothetical protein